MLKFILPLGAMLAIIPLQAQTAPTQNNQNNNQTSQATPNSTKATATNTQATPNNTQAKMDASNDISSVLNDTNQARHALVQNDKTQAMKEINAALASLNQAQTAAPHEKLVPLYTETDNYSVMGPILASRNVANGQMNQPGQVKNSAQLNANSEAKSNAIVNPNGSANANGQASDLTVQRAYGEFTSVMLDTNLARTHLQAAKQELEDGNMIKADEGLKGTQDAVIVSSAEADLPLLRARENLMLARSASNSGDHQETVEALRATGRALDNYAKFDGAHAAAAKTLAEQIGKYDHNTNITTANLTAQINNWWGQTTSWTGPGSSNRKSSAVSE